MTANPYANAAWLHLGCGDVHLDGYVNIDSRYQPGVDLVDNIGVLKKVAEGSIEQIYCCHALDHFSRWDYSRVLRRWCDILKPGGTLLLSTVDFAAVAGAYACNTSLKKLVGALYAAQDYDTNFRKMIWDFDTLHDDLMAAGFAHVGRYHSETPDCSTAMLGDRLLSLNVRAVK